MGLALQMTQVYLTPSVPPVVAVIGHVAVTGFVFVFFSGHVLDLPVFAHPIKLH